MEHALIVSKTEKSTLLFTEMLNTCRYDSIFTASSCNDAHDLLSKHCFDLVLINAPLDDEWDKSFAFQMEQHELCPVIFLINKEYYQETTTTYEGSPIFVFPKPIDAMLLQSVIKMAKMMQDQVNQLCEKNTQLSKKLEDIQIIDRAKCVLISYMQISEQEAHRYIEKQAMDMRMTKRKIAEGILRTYED